MKGDGRAADLIRQATRTLLGAGIPDAAADVRILVCAAAGIERLALLRDPDLRLDGETVRRFEAYVLRRLAREPVSRILGRREFWGLDMNVTPAVLDPRPDTETLVAAALDGLPRKGTRAFRVLDLGTGSGAILCALLNELPHAQGWAVDRSAAACRVARSNLEASGVGGRSLVLQGDWGSALAPGGFDIAVSNPPYIETSVIAGLEPDVRDHDPPVALDGGADGLDAYRAIVPDLPRLLVPGGRAVLEVGYCQAGDVAALVRQAGLRMLGTRRDLAGIERVVCAVS